MRSLRLEVAWLVFEARSGFDFVGATLLPTCSCPPQPQDQWCSLFLHGRWSDYVSVCVMLRCEHSPVFVLWSWFTGFGLL